MGNRNGASSRKGCVVNGQTTKASNKISTPPPAAPHALHTPDVHAHDRSLGRRLGAVGQDKCGAAELEKNYGGKA